MFTGNEDDAEGIANGTNVVGVSGIEFGFNMGVPELGEKLIVGTVVRGVVMSFWTVEIDVEVLTLTSLGTSSCWTAPINKLHETEQRQRPKRRVTVEHCTKTGLFPNPISKYDSTIKTQISVDGHEPNVGRKASEDSV